jgi:hypothetical protein
LLDELGILKVIFKAVGDAIGWVIQQLKDFLDWIGLTSYAAEESARKQAEAQEKIAASHEAKRAKVTDAYDHEIRLAGIAGENTVEMERQKQYAIIETSRAQIDALRLQMESLKAAGDLTKEKADEIRKAIGDLRTGIREASQEIQVINATEVADNNAANEKKAADNQAAAEKRAAQRKQEKADRLAALRAIQDAETELIKDAQLKEYEENRIKYERLIADTLANEKLLKGEKDKLAFALKQQQLAAELALDKKYLDEKLAAEKEASDKKNELVETQKQAVITAAEELAKKNEEINAAEIKQAEEKAAEKASIEQNYRDSVVALSEGIFAITNSLGKQDEKSKEERAKRQFNIQKAMNLAMAVIDGHKAITASLAQAPLAIGAVPSPVGIASLTFAIATTAANIA